MTVPASDPRFIEPSPFPNPGIHGESRKGVSPETFVETSSYSAGRCAAFFILFVLLILGGIALKRIWGHPEYMMLFHLPAAVFLVLTGIELRKRSKHLYDAEVEVVRRRITSHS